MKESVAPWEQDSAYYNDGPTNDWYTDPGEERWNQLLKMRNEGLLTDDELEEYHDLSREIARCIIKKNGKTKLSDKGKILAQKRSRLVASDIKQHT